MGLKGKLRMVWHGRSSRAYVKWLRSKGIMIGENVLFRDPFSTLVDCSRPSLVTIGNNVDINRNFQILTHDWGCYVFRNKYKDFINSSGKVTIGNNIYFGTNVIILKGVTIGDNCIIGAGSIVNRDIPADSVAIGNPCRVVCTIDEYYEKRKQRGLAEAVEYVQAIRERYGRNPYPSELREEFIYFVNRENVSHYEKDGVPVNFQLGPAYDMWLINHQSNFHSYNEFIDYVDLCVK